MLVYFFLGENVKKSQALVNTIFLSLKFQQFYSVKLKKKKQSILLKYESIAFILFQKLFKALNLRLQSYNFYHFLD